MALDIFLQFRMSNKSHGRLNQKRINWCMNNLPQKYYLACAQAPVYYSSWNKVPVVPLTDNSKRRKFLVTFCVCTYSDTNHQGIPTTLVVVIVFIYVGG